MKSYREARGLEDQIEQIERMARVWRLQADAHPPGTYGELVQQIAIGYEVQLQDLRAAGAESDAAFHETMTAMAA